MRHLRKVKVQQQCKKERCEALWLQIKKEVEEKTDTTKREEKSLNDGVFHQKSERKMYKTRK